MVSSVLRSHHIVMNVWNVTLVGSLPFAACARCQYLSPFFFSYCLRLPSCLRRRTTVAAAHAATIACLFSRPSAAACAFAIAARACRAFVRLRYACHRGTYACLPSTPVPSPAAYASNNAPPATAIFLFCYLRLPHASMPALPTCLLRNIAFRKRHTH